MSCKQKETLVMIGTKDRPTELYGLLGSLMTQTYQDFDILILDDASGTPLMNYYFLGYMMNHLRLKGHRVEYRRNDFSKGVPMMRQQMVNEGLKLGAYAYFLRVDDDSIVAHDFIEKLKDVIDAGYDIASGLSPVFCVGTIKRNVNFVKPIINQVVLDDQGNFLFNGDDCGYEYLGEEILPANHFRSNALIKRVVHEKVSYPDNMTFCGFREEEVFSFDAIVNGFKIGVHTGAKAWHLQTPSGGDRRGDYSELMQINENVLKMHTKKLFQKHGDFIMAYNKRLSWSDESILNEYLANKNKNTNLILGGKQ